MPSTDIKLMVGAGGNTGAIKIAVNKVRIMRKRAGTVRAPTIGAAI